MTADGEDQAGQGRRAAAITDADLDEIRNVCRCGTYPRIREAIKAASARM